MKKLFQALFAIALSIAPLGAVFAQSTNFGLTPTGVTQPMSVTSASSSITLNATPGNTVLIQNTGTKTAYIKAGASATTSDFPLQGGWGISLNYPPGQVVSAITGGSDTTTLTVTKGLGNFAMTGGGGGGGGGSVTQGTVPWVVAQQASQPVTGTMQSAAVANANGSTLNTTGMSAAMLTVNCATCSGGTTVNFEGTQDGTNYTSQNAVQVGTTTIAANTATAGVTVWELPVGGFSAIRARISGYSAGTVTVTGTTVPVAYNAKVIALSPTGNYTGGYDFQLAPTVTVQNAAYAAGNSMGGLITVTGAARTAGGSGVLDGLRLKSTGGATNTVWIYAHSKTPVATCTDKSAYVPSASDNPYAIPGFPTSVTLGGSPGAWDTATYAQLTSLLANFKNQDSTAGTAIYFCLVTAGAVTPATTSDMTLVAIGMQD